MPLSARGSVRQRTGVPAPTLVEGNALGTSVMPRVARSQTRVTSPQVQRKLFRVMPMGCRPLGSVCTWSPISSRTTDFASLRTKVTDASTTR